VQSSIFTENLPCRNGVSPLSNGNGDRDKFLDLMKRLKPKHRLIGDLASRGWTAQMISKELHIHYKTVMEVLKREEVIEYTNIVVRNLFLDADRLLINLFMKALITLDQQLDSTDPGVKDKAVDRILGFFQTKVADTRSKPLINQFFSGMQKGNEDLGKRLDEIVIQKRIERGLPPLPDPDDL
jgi:hypothetical protein